MPITSYRNYSQGKLSLKEIRRKETKDKENPGKTINYLNVLMNYDHPVNGSHVRGVPYYELCTCTAPMGLTKEGNKLTSFTVFDIDNKEVRDCVDVKERTEINGWIKSDKNKVEVDMGIKSCTATALNEVDIYDSPESDNKITTVPAETVMLVVDQNEEGSWLLVKSGGHDGFLSIFYNDVAQIIFDNRVACGLASLTKIEDVKGRMKAPCYWHRDKENGAFIKGKNPSAYLKHTYYDSKPARGDKPAMSERYVDFRVPGSDESLSLDILTNTALTFLPVVYLAHVYIGAGKIVPQFYVCSAIVTDIKKIEINNIDRETLSNYEQDKDLVEKLRKQLEISKSFTRVEEKQQLALTEEKKVPEKAPDLESMLTGGPKIEKVNLDNDQEDEITIPGLPNL